MDINTINIKHLATAALIAGLAGSAHAASVISVSPTAPAVNGSDIANLAASTGGDSIWSDRPVRGQTFTPAADGTLNAITFQLSVGNPPINGWKDYQLRFGTIDTGTNTITPSHVEVIRYTPDADPLDYFTITLDAPIALTANTLYGFDLGVENSQNGWQSGIPSIQKTGDNYAGGTKISGAKPNEIDNTTGGTNFGVSSQGGNDLVFHLDIEASSVVPTPSAALAGAFALGGLAVRRRRRG